VGGVGARERKIAAFLGVCGRNRSNGDRGALAIDSVRQSVRRDRLGKMAGKAAEQRSGQAGCVGGGAEEGRGAAAFCRPGGSAIEGALIRDGEQHRRDFSSTGPT